MGSVVISGKTYKQKLLTTKDLKRLLGYESVVMGRYGVFVAKKKR